MLNVKNNESGKVEQLQDDSVLPDLVSSGKVSLPNKEFEFQSDDGKKYSVPAKGFLEAVKQGWKYRDNTVKREEDLQAKYGDSTAKALLYGGARGLTFGLSDPLLTSTGIETPEALSEIKKRNSEASIGAEVVGAVAPALFTGGTGTLASMAGKSIPGLTTKIAARAGSRAAQNVASKVAQKAIDLGVAGAVEGGLVGVGQTISEAALGDAEFNAESLLSNVGTGAAVGGLFGGALGAGSEYISKATKFGKKQVTEKLIQQIDGDEAFKAEIRSKIANGEAMEQGILATKDPEIARIISQYPDAPVTPGMESAIKPIKDVEKYLYDAPTLQGESIRKSSKEIESYVDNKIDEIWKGARTASPEETGDLIRQKFLTQINEPWQSGKTYYDDLMGEFGNAPVSQKYRTELSNEIKNSDAFRIGAEGSDIKRVLGIVDDKKAMLASQAEELQLLGLNKRQISTIQKEGGISAKMNTELNNSGVNLKQFNDTMARHAAEMPKTELTLRQVKELQSDVGASMKLAKGSERKLLRQTYDKLRTMQDSIIRETVGDSKAAKKVIAGLDAANADYVRAYKAKDEIADLFGVKGSDFDTVMEKLENMSAIDLEKKFMNIKKTDKANQILDKYPEIGKLVLANRQNALIKKHILQGDVVNYAGIKKDLLKMSNEERAIYFGGSKQQEKRAIDMMTLWEKRPKTMNPSGTDVRRELRDLLSPKTQAQNWVLGELYKGNDSFVGRMINKVMPDLAGVERSANKTKNKISSSISGFIKNSKVGISKSAVEAIPEEKIKKASKVYEDIQSDPGKVVDQFNKNNASLLDSAPETYSALQSKIIAGVQFLQSKSPKIDQDYMFQNREPSRSEVMAFSDYLEAVESPGVIYDQIAKGYINPRTVEALKVVYPKIYQGLVAEFIAKKPKVLSRTQMIEAQKLLGVRVMPAMDKDKFAILQNMTAASQQAGQQTDQMMSPKVASAKEMKSSERNMTGLDAALYRS